ncbi:MAG: hypothetical protein ACH349_01370 [Candidatus Rhabdochlamydia sp.]
MDLYAITTQQVLERISRHCPDALCAYLQCMNRADQKGSVYFSKSIVEVDMSEGWLKFRNQIKKLALENLLEWHPFNNGIAVTLAEIDANE